MFLDDSQLEQRQRGLDFGSPEEEIRALSDFQQDLHRKLDYED